MTRKQIGETVPEALASEIGAILLQFFLQLPGFPLGQLVKKRPEALPMIHFTGVSQFVQQHIVYQVLRKQDKIKGKIDVPARRATAPSAVTGIDSHPLIGQTMLPGEHIQPWRKDNLRITPQSLLNDLPQPCLQCRVREIGLRRTDYLRLPQLRTGEKSLPLPAHEVQLEELRINPVVQVYQRSDALLPRLPQSGTKFFYRPLHCGKRRTGRHSHVNGIFLGTERQATRTGIDPNQQAPQLFIFQNFFQCNLPLLLNEQANEQNIIRICKWMRTSKID